METKIGADLAQGTREKLARDVSEVANQAGEYVRDMSGRVGEKLQGARATLADAQTAVTERAREAADMTDEYVRMNPWKSLGVAAVAGLLVGVLLGRR